MMEGRKRQYMAFEKNAPDYTVTYLLMEFTSDTTHTYIPHMVDFCRPNTD